MNCINCMTPIKGKCTTCASCGKPLHKDCAVYCITCGKPICDTCSIANNFKCKNCISTNKFKIDFIRRSHIELYLMCPYAFYLACVLGLPTNENAYAKTGIIVHEIIDYHSQNPEQKDEEVFTMWREKFNELPNEIFATPQQKAELFARGKKSLQVYLDYEAMMPLPLATEETVFMTIEDDLPQIRVTIDRINKTKNGLEIIDWKTGKVHVGQKLALDLQIPTYLYAAYTKYGEYPQYMKLIFLAEEKERVYELASNGVYICQVGKNIYTQDVQKQISKVKSIFSRIRNREFGIPDKLNSYICNQRCDFGRTGQCDGSLEQKWKMSNL
jgi:RecB family exonuclease